MLIKIKNWINEATVGDWVFCLIVAILSVDSLVSRTRQLLDWLNSQV